MVSRRNEWESGTMKKNIQRRQRRFRKRLVLTLLSVISTIILVAVYVLVSSPPEKAEAKGNYDQYCTSCHTTAPETDATSYVARQTILSTNPLPPPAVIINGVNQPSATVWIGAGKQLEIDWYANNVVATDPAHGIELIVPSGWTVAPGTANSPGLTNWSTQWDETDKNGAASSPGWGTAYQRTDQGQPANTDGYSIDFTVAPGDVWKLTSAADDSGAGKDRDAVANRMGTDVRITVGGGASGDYFFYLDNVGHQGPTRTTERATLNVYIANITAFWAQGAPYDIGGETIDIRTTVNNTSANTLSGSRFRYWVFRDTTTADGKPTAGEPYLRNDNTWNSGGYTANWRTSEYSGEKAPGDLASGSTTVIWNDRTNTNFPDYNATYTTYVEWYQDASTYQVIYDSNCTFQSIPTLGWWLTMAVVLFVVLVGAYGGTLHLRRVRAA